MAYNTNQFCWHGLVSTDTEKASAFYQEVMGWKTTTMQMGDSTATMFEAGGVPFAHLMDPPMEGMPSHWSNYLRVDDVAATTKAATENGGATMMPPTDIPVGTFSVVTSPSGAAIHLFHEADEAKSEHHPGGVGGVLWTEMYSKDIDKDLEWLKATFGFEIGEMPMPEGKYYLLKVDGKDRGGAMTSMMPEAPAMWMSWIHVEDVDAAAERVTNNGGKTLGPIMDMPNIGRMVVAQDPTGGVIGLMTPAAKG